MYESLITRITEDIVKDIVKREEDYLMELLYKVGFDIGKEELAKALRYDRDQYEKGFNDGRLSAKPGWIPCSERLPEDDTLMLVNYIDNRPDAGDIWIGWHEMENVWYINGEEHSEECGNEVVAWMPLPEPWKGEYDV